MRVILERVLQDGGIQRSINIKNQPTEGLVINAQERYFKHDFRWKVHEKLKCLRRGESLCLLPTYPKTFYQEEIALCNALITMELERGDNSTIPSSYFLACFS
jgi:hypothetical protein